MVQKGKIVHTLDEKLLSRLAPQIATSIQNTLPFFHAGFLEEIRLRIDRPIVLTFTNGAYPLETICRADMLQNTVQRLCDHSLYSHAETLRDGYICADGIRVGVCGRSVVENGRITALRDITSLCIRLPHRIQSAGQAVYDALIMGGFCDSVLVFSPPGRGKTTVLRELAAKLSDPPNPVRVALVDTRVELGVGLENCLMLDILSGYPRSIGIEIALRTLSPDYIVCDEISSTADRQALLQCYGSGVRVCASIHADSLDALYTHPVMQDLPPMFQWFYGISSDHQGTLYPREGGCDHENHRDSCVVSDGSPI